MDKNVRHEGVPEHRDASSSSEELPMGPLARVVSGKHSVFTHFQKDPNCDICLQTKITSASCRRRTGTIVPRAEHSGDAITADHKVLSEGCESRHNHRCAVVVQDLASQWLQSYMCKTKTSQETEKCLMMFLEPTRKPKVIYTDNSLEFGKSCEELFWNHCTSTPMVEYHLFLRKTCRDCINLAWCGSQTFSVKDVNLETIIDTL